MAEIALADRQNIVTGEPQWIEPSFVRTAGRDPLGFQTITIDRILPKLLPGVLALSRRARYFSLYPFLLDEYQKHRLPATNKDLSRFIKQREYEYALAVQLCPACGPIPSGAVGKDRAAPAVRVGGTVFERRESVETPLGGYGLYYRTPLIDLGLVAPAGTAYADDQVTPVDVLVPDRRARRLAETFRSAIAETEYYCYHMYATTPITRSVLQELSESACLCRLHQFPEEQAAVRQALLESSDREPVQDTEQRRRSFALFLALLDQSPPVADDDAAFRRALWPALDANPDIASSRAGVMSQWAALVAKEYLQEAVSNIWSAVCRHGYERQGANGFARAEWHQLVHDVLLGTGRLELPGGPVEYGPGTPTSTFRTATSRAVADLTLEGFRTWALAVGSAPAGLALLLALYDRLPDPAMMPAGWVQIGAQRSDHQPGLLAFGRLLQDHLVSEPTLAETLTWIVGRYVLEAHEAIAYSKLPNFTFRFRWDRGRLRFYDIGRERFELTDNRRPALARLSQDIGLWSGGSDGSPRVTPAGERFVAEVFP